MKRTLALKLTPLLGLSLLSIAACGGLSLTITPVADTTCSSFTKPPVSTDDIKTISRPLVDWLNTYDRAWERQCGAAKP